MNYTEKRPFARRSYELTDRLLTIAGSAFFGSTFRVEIQLAQVKLVPDVVSVKDSTRTAYVGTPGFLVFVVGLCATHFLYGISPILYFTILGIGIAAMMFGFIFGGRIKAYVFKNHAETVIFDITERGNPRPEFEAFVELLKTKIKAVQK